KALSDRPRRAQRDIDHFGRHPVKLEGAEAALVRASVGPILDHLPMSTRHPVLADEQRFAGKDTDAPVEFGRQEFLREHKVGPREQRLDDALELGKVADLMHAARERAVWNLDDQRKPKLVRRPREIAAFRQDHGWWNRHLIETQKLDQEYLIGAS